MHYTKPKIPHKRGTRLRLSHKLVTAGGDANIYRKSNKEAKKVRKGERADTEPFLSRTATPSLPPRFWGRRGDKITAASARRARPADCPGTALPTKFPATGAGSAASPDPRRRAPKRLLQGARPRCSAPRVPAAKKLGGELPVKTEPGGDARPVESKSGRKRVFSSPLPATRTPASSDPASRGAAATARQSSCKRKKGTAVRLRGGRQRAGHGTAGGSPPMVTPQPERGQPARSPGEAAESPDPKRRRCQEV